MSKITTALEAAVACVIENTPKGELRQTARQRANADKAFARILKLIAPRIRHFIRQYGLTNHWEDAEQCCAIGVHRAIQAYEPEKAQFTTFVNWQIRGELQSLRFRLMTDQRPSAKKVDATTISLHAVSTGADGEENSLEALIEDENALALTESGASNHLAENARNALTDSYVNHLRATGMEQLKRRARATRPVAQNPDVALPRFRPHSQPIDPVALAELEQKIALYRDVVGRRLFDDATLDDLGAENGVAKERIRQITKRAAKTMAELAAQDSRFASMAEHRKPKPATRPKKIVAAISILADGDAPHNQLTRVVAIGTDGDRDAAITITAGKDFVTDFDLEALVTHAGAPGASTRH